MRFPFQTSLVAAAVMVDSSGERSSQLTVAVLLGGVGEEQRFEALVRLRRYIAEDGPKVSAGYPACLAVDRADPDQSAPRDLAGGQPLA